MFACTPIIPGVIPGGLTRPRLPGWGAAAPQSPRGGQAPGENATRSSVPAPTNLNFCVAARRSKLLDKTLYNDQHPPENTAKINLRSSIPTPTGLNFCTAAPHYHGTFFRRRPLQHKHLRSLLRFSKKKCLTRVCACDQLITRVCGCYVYAAVVGTHHMHAEPPK